jgi:hypothetical protein
MTFRKKRFSAMTFRKKTFPAMREEQACCTVSLQECGQDFFSDPVVSKGGGACEACGKVVDLLSSSGMFGEHEATGAIFNCNLGDPRKLPCRHVVCYSCVPKIQKGSVKLHVYEQG